MLRYISKLHDFPVKIEYLEETGIGIIINGLRKIGGEIAVAAKSLVSIWRKAVVEDPESAEGKGKALGCVFFTFFCRQVIFCWFTNVRLQTV